ncbi:CapA family protein [Streptomyces brasiliensis]|uniref:Polyglutamine synthesis accessory protein n=1 Tax=Streptomyces brasiliensis TaxID=1954 RepID=A0A917K1T5_9ACTN|nr:CapA family protein [Streptomyces brasiliensis]GGI94076.1 putative polyglutamine synthesis accessory protein [Streptomyces brasiliensis]
MGEGLVTLSLCGDVMLGRGVDQVLPHPGDPELREAYLHDARAYVGLAEAVNGPIPRPVAMCWPWGEALAAMEEAAPDARIVNLETSVTRDGSFMPGKGVHYRMNPANLPCLAVARPDVCVLANNHVLDFGRTGLEETLAALADAGLRTAGAGRNAEEARAPAIVPVEGGGRVLVFSCGMSSSGIPHVWAACGRRSGVAFVAGPSVAAATELTGRLQEAKRPGDVVVVSIHWGANWGFSVSRDEVRFAHALVDGGADVVHGHSSHHPRPVEVYRGKLILYGCGDFVDDYEGIRGYERYRDDLRLLYLVTLAAAEPGAGVPVGVRMVPFQARRMRLERASAEDAEWLRATVDRAGRRFGSRVDRGPDDILTVRPSRDGRQRT